MLTRKENSVGDYVDRKMPAKWLPLFVAVLAQLLLLALLVSLLALLDLRLIGVVDEVRHEALHQLLKEKVRTLP